MEKLDKIMGILKKVKGFECGEGVSKELILKAEKRLNLTFSPQYTYFLETYGWLEIIGYEIFGIISEEFCAIDVVGATEDFRYFNGYSNDIMVIQNLDEEFVSFDYTQINNNGEPRIVYNTIFNIVEDAAEDFISYLEAKYEEMVEW